MIKDTRLWSAEDGQLMVLRPLHDHVRPSEAIRRRRI